MVICGRRTETQELLPVPFSITLLCLHCPVPWEATCVSCPMVAPLTSLIIPYVGGTIDGMVTAEEDEDSLPFNLGVCFHDDYISLQPGWLWHGPWDSSASNLDSILSLFVLRVINSLLLLFVSGFMAIFCSFGLSTPLALVPSLKTNKNQ